MQSFEQPHVVSFDHLEGSVAVAHTAFGHRAHREVYHKVLGYATYCGSRATQKSCFAWERRSACRLSQSSVNREVLFISFHFLVLTLHLNLNTKRCEFS